MSKKQKSISDLRKEIDRIDQNIAKLITKRALRACAITQFKKSAQLPLVDRHREAMILNLYFQELKKVANKTRTKKLVQALIALNPELP